MRVRERIRMAAGRPVRLAVPPGADPFLRAIGENEADVGAKGVFADWLEEQNDPRHLIVRGHLDRPQMLYGPAVADRVEGDGYGDYYRFMPVGRMMGVHWWPDVQGTGETSKGHPQFYAQLHPEEAAQVAEKVGMPPNDVEAIRRHGGAAQLGRLGRAVRLNQQSAQSNSSVVWHGSPHGDFDHFDPAHVDGRTDKFYGRGFYFAPERAEAEAYGSARPFRTSIKNPFVLPANGYASHDGLFDLRDRLAGLRGGPAHLKTDRQLPAGGRLEAVERPNPLHQPADPNSRSTVTMHYVAPAVGRPGPERDTPLAAIVHYNDRRQGLSVGHGTTSGLIQESLGLVGQENFHHVLQANGYDGIHVVHPKTGRLQEVAAFHPDQIEHVRPEHMGMGRLRRAVRLAGDRDNPLLDDALNAAERRRQPPVEPAPDIFTDYAPGSQDLRRHPAHDPQAPARPAPAAPPGPAPKARAQGLARLRPYAGRTPARIHPPGPGGLPEPALTPRQLAWREADAGRTPKPAVPPPLPPFAPPVARPVATPVAQPVALPVARHIPVGRLEPPGGRPAPPLAPEKPQGWFGREWQQFKHDLSPLTGAVGRVRKRLGFSRLRLGRDDSPGLWARLGQNPLDRGAWGVLADSLDEEGKGAWAQVARLLHEQAAQTPWQADVPMAHAIHPAAGAAGSWYDGSRHTSGTLHGTHVSLAASRQGPLRVGIHAPTGTDEPGPFYMATVLVPPEWDGALSHETDRVHSQHEDEPEQLAMSGRLRRAVRLHRADSPLIHAQAAANPLDRAPWGVLADSLDDDDKGAWAEAVRFLGEHGEQAPWQNNHPMMVAVHPYLGGYRPQGWEYSSEHVTGRVHGFHVTVYLHDGRDRHWGTPPMTDVTIHTQPGQPAAGFVLLPADRAHPLVREMDEAQEGPLSTLYQDARSLASRIRGAATQLRRGTPVRMSSPHTLAALWAAIRANPHDDAPWLVAADALDEMGHGHAADLFRRIRQSPDSEVRRVNTTAAERSFDFVPDVGTDAYRYPAGPRATFGTIGGLPFRLEPMGHQWEVTMDSNASGAGGMRGWVDEATGRGLFSELAPHPEWEGRHEQMRRLLAEDEPERFKRYPLAPRAKWRDDPHHQRPGGKFTWVRPEDFLKGVPPLGMSAGDRRVIDRVKKRIAAGKKLNPLMRGDGDEHDGRHRAHAAVESGVKWCPLMDYSTEKKAAVKAARGSPVKLAMREAATCAALDCVDLTAVEIS